MVSPQRARPIPSVVWTAAAAMGAVAVLAGLGWGGWPGAGNGCRVEMRPACFCERPRPGLVAQPANTASNLAFVAVGLAIAASVDRRWRRAPAGVTGNPLVDTRFLPTLYAVVVALLGPGSMALHASLTRWGGQVDVASMYLFSALLVAIGAQRAFGLSPAGFVAFYAGLAAALVASKLWAPVSSDAVFGTSLAAAAALDLRARTRAGVRREGRFALAAVALFGLAFAIWLPSRSGGALCDPDAWLQGHAAWHVLCALSAGAIFLYLRSEQPPEGARFA